VTDVTDPESRPHGRRWHGLVMAVLLLVLAPLWVGFVFDRFYGPSYLYLGYGVGFVVGLAVFVFERWLIRRRRR
jgi:hypothetical protein